MKAILPHTVAAFLVVAAFDGAKSTSDKVPELGMSKQDITEILGPPATFAGKMIMYSSENARQSSFIYLDVKPPREYIFQEGACVSVGCLGCNMKEVLGLIKLHAKGHNVMANGENKWKCPDMRWFANYRQINGGGTRLDFSRWDYP